MQNSEEKLEAILFSLYPELKNVSSEAILEYVNNIDNSIKLQEDVVGYYDAMAATMDARRYSRDQEPLFAIALLRHSVLLRYLPKAHHTEKLWDLIFSITNKLDVMEMMYLLDAFPKTLVKKYFNKDRALNLLNYVNCCRNSGIMMETFIDALIPVAFMQDKEFITKAISTGISFECLYPYIKKYNITVDLDMAKYYLELIKDNIEDIKYLPAAVRDELITPEVAKKIVNLKPDLFEYIPVNVRNEDLCLLAVKKRGILLRYVPKFIANTKIYEAALKNDGESIAYVPEDARDIKLCTLAVKTSGKAFKLMPQSIQTSALASLAVKSDYTMLRCVIKELVTPELCKLAIQNTYAGYKYIPEDMRTKVITDLAVTHTVTKSQFKSIAKYIPTNLLSSYSHLQ